MAKRRFLILLICLILLPLINAEIQIGVSEDEGVNDIGINFQPVVTPFNNNTGSVNFSEFSNLANFAFIWITNEGNMDNVPDLYPTLDGRYLQLSGGTMTGDININFNEIHNLAGLNLTQDINLNTFNWLVPTPILPNHTANKDYVDDATSSTAFDFFFNNESSNIPGHFNMTENDLERPENTLDSASLPQGTFSIFNWTTLVGQPEFNELRQGVYDVHVHLNTDGPGKKPVTITPKLYNVSADGLTRNLLVTFETSDLLLSVGVEFDLHGVLVSPIMLANGERLNLELEAEVGAGGGDVTVTITMEGTTDSHLSIQTSTNAFEKIFIRRDGTNTLVGNWQVDSVANPFNINMSGNVSATKLEVDHIAEKTGGHGVVVDGADSSITIEQVNLGGILDYMQLNFADSIGNNFGGVSDRWIIKGFSPQFMFIDDDLTKIGTITFNPGATPRTFTYNAQSHKFNGDVSIQAIVGFDGDLSIDGTIDLGTDTITDGNWTSAGNITANFFIGDGSQLTGITGGDGGWQPNNLTEDNNYTTTGNVSADFYFGDGSQLTNIPHFNQTYQDKADYQFLNNNFNGTGNFNTTGTVQATNITTDVINSINGLGINIADDVNLGTKDLRTNNVYLGGGSEMDSFLYFFNAGSEEGRFLKWDDFSSRFNLAGGIDIDGDVFVDNLISRGDIYTVGTNDDLWLGNPTQGSANFRAFANGNLIAKGKSDFGSTGQTSILADGTIDLGTNTITDGELNGAWTGVTDLTATATVQAGFLKGDAILSTNDVVANNEVIALGGLVEIGQDIDDDQGVLKFDGDSFIGNLIFDPSLPLFSFDHPLQVLSKNLTLGNGSYTGTDTSTPLRINFIGRDKSSSIDWTEFDEDQEISAVTFNDVFISKEEFRAENGFFALSTDGFDVLSELRFQGGDVSFTRDDEFVGESSSFSIDTDGMIFSVGDENLAMQFGAPLISFRSLSNPLQIQPQGADTEIGGDVSIDGKLNVSESIEYNGTLITHSPFITKDAETGKYFFADYITETTGFCRLIGRDWNCDGDNIKVLSKISGLETREQNRIQIAQERETCKVSGYSYDRQGCYEIVKTTANRGTAIETYQEEIMEEVASTCQRLDRRLNVVSVDCSTNVGTGKFEDAYRFNDGCDWNKRDGLYCEVRQAR